MDAQWNDYKKRKMIYLLMKRLEYMENEIEMTRDILKVYNIPDMETLETEFELKSEKKLNNWVSS
jgi:hypothetical protein